MPAKIQRLPDGLLYPRYQCCDVRCLLDAGLDNCKLVAAESGHEIGVADAAAQPARNGHEQLIAHRMPKRIVDRLEVIEIEIKNRELGAAMNPAQLLVQPLAEHHAIWQVGQRIIMREMRDPLLRALALGDVLMGGDPSAAGE